jgi:hypothetical protein
MASFQNSQAVLADAAEMAKRFSIVHHPEALR